ncbi:DUF4190 domain-containing protein [Hyphobacterium sp. CCMP332]|nr:DUF4190 domain-containing protein [Hyphobacterium sp. CCMP332]
MKRFIIISLGFILLTLYSSCQKNISLFNHVPWDYYTRHHSSEIKTPEKEPILCLKNSEGIKRDKTRDLISIYENSADKTADLDFSVSKKNFEPLPNSFLWDNSDYLSYSNNTININEAEDFKKKKRRSRLFGLIAGALGISSVVSVFLGSASLFLILVGGSIAFGIASNRVHPEKSAKKAKENLKEDYPENETIIAEELLSNKERQNLEIEKLGFFSFLSGFFSIFLTLLAFGPYNSAILIAFIPFLALMSFIFGVYSLSKHKKNTQKFRGKGYAYAGIGIGSVYLLFALFVFILILGFYSIY